MSETPGIGRTPASHSDFSITPSKAEPSKLDGRVSGTARNSIKSSKSAKPVKSLKNRATVMKTSESNKTQSVAERALNS